MDLSIEEEVRVLGSKMSPLSLQKRKSGHYKPENDLPTQATSNQLSDRSFPASVSLPNRFHFLLF